MRFLTPHEHYLIAEDFAKQANVKLMELLSVINAEEMVEQDIYKAREIFIKGMDFANSLSRLAQVHATLANCTSGSQRTYDLKVNP